jgi:hypothetical protein
MSNGDGTRIIPRRTPESEAMVASAKRAMAITPILNRLTYDDGSKVCDTALLELCEMPGKESQV